MWSTPSSIARRSTARAASGSRGGPKTPGPASCIAPKPMRLTGLSPRKEVVFIPAALEIRCGRQPDVVLGELAGAGFAAIDVLQAGELQLLLERALAEVVQQLRHVVGEVLCAPHPAQRVLGVGAEEAVVALLVVRLQCGGEQPGVVDREVEALGARRRDDVRGVAREVEVAVLHRRGDERAHRGDALLEDLALADAPALGGEPDLQLLPD